MHKKGVPMLRASILLLSLSSLIGCATTPSKSSASPLAVVEQYHSALNRRDLLVLTAYVTPDVAWYSVVNGERIQEVSGRAALLETLRSYFAQNLKTHWAIESSTVVNQVVSVRERSQWQESDSSDERVSLAVYEVHDGRIARITYFLDAPKP
jgi:limonene-1,2-epoxide hydrolase